MRFFISRRLRTVVFAVFVVFISLFCLPLTFAAPKSDSQTTSRPLNIGILRHAPCETAEQKLMAAAIQRGHHIEMINPLHLIDALETQAGSLTSYDVVISRAEMDSFADNITDAYLRTLDYLESQNIPVINNAKATLDAQDKFRTLLRAQQAGIRIPETFLVYTLDNIQNLLTTNRLRFPFVVKTPYGGCGEGVFLIESHADLTRTLKQHFPEGAPILIQERLYLETNETGNFRDMRIWVMRDPNTNQAKFIGGVYRNAQNGNFLTNLHTGGNITAMTPYPKDVIEMSERALEAIGADVAGIDLARDKNGNLYLLEINISFYTEEIFEETIAINLWEQVVHLAETRVFGERI